MPNEVYEAAVEGLSSLVSPRVAKRIIDDSLRATSRTADDVSSTAMRRLLLGRVRSELEGVMPAAAVGPGLIQLAEELQSSGSSGRMPWWRRIGRERRSRSDAAAGDTKKVSPRDTDSREAERERLGVTRSSVYLPGGDPGMTPETAPTAPRTSAPSRGSSNGSSRAAVAVASASSSQTNSSPTAVSAGAPLAVTQKALPTLTPDLIERALRVFADLETVRQIVAVQRGEVIQASGTGLDAERLTGLSVATTGLLSKAGTLRVFSLEHQAGVLFLFPLRDGALVVLTQPKVNIGAVLSARAALEEAA